MAKVTVEEVRQHPGKATVTMEVETTYPQYLSFSVPLVFDEPHVPGGGQWWPTDELLQQAFGQLSYFLEQAQEAIRLHPDSNPQRIQSYVDQLRENHAKKFAKRNPHPEAR